MILDEASRVKDVVLDALSPMLATSDGTLIVLSTPAGRKGVFHRLWTEGGDDWERFTVQAKDCPRHGEAFLESERRRMGDRIYAEEYGAEFVADEEDARNPRLVRPEAVARLRAMAGPADDDDDEPPLRAA
ncbi:MAG: hypothetical protein IPP07_26805 [Holophagales bacterium]|nr:hypothetical protein [Holophagales bacterium]